MISQEEYFGLGSLNKLETILKKENLKKVFLVTGKNSFILSGARKKIENILDKNNIDYERFSNFSPNPQLSEIKKATKIFNKGKYDSIIAVGGGSAIDVAKAIKIYKKISHKKPLIAIPTTAGSGSEATSFIVYYTGKEKQSKGNLDITLPNYSICDPELTFSLPKKIAASTGIDALGQAIESYWSINSIEKSKQFAQKSIKLLLNNLEQAVNNPTNESKENVMKAANLAGKAINISKTTACHSISYPITSYFNIPHGHAVGLTLGQMLEYNFGVTPEDCLDKRGEKYVQNIINNLVNLLGVKNVSQAREKIKNLMSNIGLETNLSNLGVHVKDLEILVEKGFSPERVKNNPRLLTKDSLRKILNNLY